MTMTTAAPELAIVLIHKSLAESYSSLDLDYVRDQVRSLEAGNKPTNIIAMLAEKSLKDAGYL
jgi:hypothetical protein